MPHRIGLAIAGRGPPGQGPGIHTPGSRAAKRPGAGESRRRAPGYSGWWHADDRSRAPERRVAPIVAPANGHSYPDSVSRPSRLVCSSTGPADCVLPLLLAEPYVLATAAVLAIDAARFTGRRSRRRRHVLWPAVRQPIVSRNGSRGCSCWSLLPPESTPATRSTFARPALPLAYARHRDHPISSSAHEVTARHGLRLRAGSGRCRGQLGGG